MEEVVQKIREKISSSKKGCLSYRELYDVLNGIKDKKKNDFIIKSLELQGEIYNKDGLYFEFPENLKIGTIESNKKGSCYILAPDNSRLFIKDYNLNGALPYDKVVYRINEKNEIVIKKILQRKSANVVCEIAKENKKYSLVPRNIKGKLNIQINQDTLKDIGNGKFVLVKLSEEQISGTFDGEIVKQIVLDGKIDESLALIAYSNDFEIDFSEESQKQTEEIPDHVLDAEIEARKENDFRNKKIFTIDGLDTKDMDDAISIEILPNGNYELGVHIANVSYYMKPNTPLFNEARRRSTSLYMLNTVIPMLPEKLSNGICSLNEGVDRLAKSVIMEIDHQGKIVSSRICDSIINSKKKMNYDDVNKVLNGEIPAGYEEFKDELLQMGKLSKILSSQRNNQGKIDFASNEVKISLDENGNPVDFAPRENLPAEKLIENFMVSANETVASYVSWMNLPFVYRTHEGPNKFKLDEALQIIKAIGYNIHNKEVLQNPKMVHYILDKLKDAEEYPILSNILLKSMSKAKYSAENTGHFALASSAYTHFTSPIRRFPDVMVHSLLDYYNDIALGNIKIDLNLLDEIEDELELSCDYASQKERQADSAEYEAERQKMIEYMRALVGISFEASITMINERSIQIITDDGITGFVGYKDILHDNFNFHSNNYSAIGRNTKTKYKIGNRVKVTLLRIDEGSKELYFSLDEKIKQVTTPSYQLTMQP